MFPRPSLTSAAGGAAIRARLLLHWAVLAFVPAALLSGTIERLDAELGTGRLFALVPMALYAASVAVVLAQPRPVHPAVLKWVHSPLLLFAALFASPIPPSYLAAGGALMLLTLFVSALACHGELARLRPAAEERPAFLAALALGAGLGLAFVAAPGWADYSYPALLVMTALLRPRTDRSEDAEGEYRISTVPVLREIAAPASGLTIIWLLDPSFHHPGATSAALFGLVLIFLALFALLSAGRPMRFALCLAALTVFGAELSAIR